MNEDNNYLELRQYNTTDTIQEAIIKNHRTLPIVDDGDYNVTVCRFTCDSTQIPTFIPRIEPPKNSMLLNENGLPHSNYWQTVGVNWNEYYYVNYAEGRGYATNLEFAIEMPSSSGLPSVNFNYGIMQNDAVANITTSDNSFFAGDRIYWIPENITETPPSTISRQSILRSRYFHCYSQAHLFQLFVTRLNQLMAMIPCATIRNLWAQNIGQIQMDTIGGIATIFIPWALLSNSLFQEMNIIINDELKNLFGFHTVPHHTIPNANILVIKYELLQSTNIGINNTKYGLISEQYSSSDFFPFVYLGFTSNLQCRPLLQYNNATVVGNAQENNATSNILTDFFLDLSGDTLQNFYTRLIYQPEQYSRKIKLVHTNNQNLITLSLYLQTSDGYTVPVYLAPNAQCSILLQFQEC